MKKLSIVWATFFIAVVAITLQACQKESVRIDKKLFDMATETDGFTWFENSDAWLPMSSGSAHSFANLRTRYNSVAASQLNSDGRILPNAVFPEGSLVVKELSDGNSAELYAILYKRSDSEFADANGWVWGYVNSDESVRTSAEQLGSGCISCHSGSGNIDYMLMNVAFP